MSPPEYQKFSTVFLSFAKDAIWQSGFFGLLLTFGLFNYYQTFLSLARVQLGEYGSDPVIFSIFLSLIHTLSYAIINGIFFFFDYYGFFQQYKLFRKPYMTPKKSLLVKTLVEAALSQFIINPIAAYYLYGLCLRLGMLQLDSPLPSAISIFKTYVIAFIFNNVFFYFAHRVFHSQLLYSTFHKQHHEFNGTIGIAAEYANPAEQILANLFPTLGGVVLFPTHPLCIGIWLVRILY